MVFVLRLVTVLYLYKYSQLVLSEFCDIFTLYVQNMVKTVTFSYYPNFRCCNCNHSWFPGTFELFWLRVS